MFRRNDGVVSDGDIAIRANEDGDAAGPRRLFIFRRAIGDGRRAAFVAQQIIGKVELRTERGVIGHRVPAYAENDGVAVVEILDSITEPVAFDRSSRGIGFWIPPEQDVLALEIVQRHRRPVLVCHGERRRFAACLYQGDILPLFCLCHVVDAVSVPPRPAKKSEQ